MPGTASVPIRRGLTSTGARLALVQIAILAGAFVVAGWLAKPVIHRVLFNDAETHVRAEAETLRGEFISGGRPQVIASLALRSQRRDGVYYRLDTADGRQLAGSLPVPPANLGLSFIDGDDLPSIPNPILRQDIVVYAERLPSGDILTAGEALGARNQLQKALLRDLWWCGLLAVGGGLLASLLLYRGVVGRMDVLTDVAREAALGRLDVRAPQRRAWLRDDIDDLSGAVNHMLGRINGLMQNVRMVSADIAHDLRTPLTRVGQKLDALRRRNAGAPGLAEDIEVIHGDLAEALRTFDAMLRLAEIESHPSRTVEAIDLARLAHQVGEAYRPDAEESGRRLDVFAGSASTTGDPDLVVQAAANLLDNAMRHTPPGTHVVLATGIEGGQSFLAVRDDGPGIDEAHRAMVLERFVRLEASRSSSGTGLGLAIVAAVAQRHRARLDLMDRAPGLEVRISFPADDAGRAPAGASRRAFRPSKPFGWFC